MALDVARPISRSRFRLPFLLGLGMALASILARRWRRQALYVCDARGSRCTALLVLSLFFGLGLGLPARPLSR